MGPGGVGRLAGLEDRYVTLAAPLLCGLYLAWALAAPEAVGRFVAMSLFCAGIALLWPNTERAIETGRDLREHTTAFERDLGSGMPTYALVRRYSPYLHPSQDVLSRELDALRTHQIGRFRDLRPNPPFEEVPLPLDPVDVRLARWNEGTVEVTGVDPQLTFALPESRYVAGVRLRYSHENAAGAPARFQLSWSQPGQPGFPASQRYANWALPTGPDHTTTIWIDAPVERLRIQPDNRPGTFRLHEMTLLVPGQRPD